VSAKAVLEIEIGGGLAGHPEIEGRTDGAHVLDQLNGASGERTVDRRDREQGDIERPAGWGGATAETSGRRAI
jgi:hypothetical protein